MNADAMTDLVNTVLARYAADLRAAADGPEFEHLARRAEARFNTDLGRRERDLVDEERARRVFTASIEAVLELQQANAVLLKARLDGTATDTMRWRVDAARAVWDALQICDWQVTA
jgi:hypothetical protein